MLYPTTTDPVAVNGVIVIDPGHLHVFTLDLLVDGALPLVVTHVAPVQDHSLRVWVATVKGGSNVVDRPYHQSFWHPNRIPFEFLTIVGPNGTATGSVLTLEPGRYYLHVLNLINATNAYTYSNIAPI